MQDDDTCTGWDACEAPVTRVTKQGLCMSVESELAEARALRQRCKDLERENDALRNALLLLRDKAGV